jgi:hypothetical protein
LTPLEQTLKMGEEYSSFDENQTGFFVGF